MDKLLYVSMTGASQNMIQQNIQANNLANVDTGAFKADFSQARSMPVFGEHYPTRVYAMTEQPGTDFSAGRVVETGRDLDLIIKEGGWFTVLDAEGKEAFTRNGNLSIDTSGLVQTQAGQALVGGGGPLILPEFEKIEIGTDGIISIRPIGQGPEGLAEVAQIKLVKPDLNTLEKGPDGLFRRKDGATEPVSSEVKIQTGFLESSNVNPISALMEIISLQKQFEMQVKMMDKADTLDQSTAKIIQFS